jgi:hypothetical protein
MRWRLRVGGGRVRHRFGQIAAVALTLVASISMSSAQAQVSVERAGPPLSEQALRARLFAIADDSMRGRAAGSEENRKATAYPSSRAGLSRD